MAARVRHESSIGGCGLVGAVCQGECLHLLFKLDEIWSVDSQEMIKIIATRCQILRLKCTKFDLRWGYAPDPAGRAYSAPQIP